MQTPTFSSLNITIGGENGGFVGKKKDMDEVIDQPIIIHDFTIQPSKFPEKYANDKCLWLQIEMEGEKCVCFSSSKYLMMQLEQVSKDQLPRSTVIKKQQNRSLMFT